MRRIFPALLLLLFAACGGGSRSLEGSLADSTSATEVWLAGSAERTPVRNGAFRIDRVDADTLELRFADGQDDAARMTLYDLPGKGSVRMEGIWFQDGLAFPARIASPTGHTIVVNGLRLSAPDAVPEKVDLPGTVLSIDDEGSALILRPADASLPDLQVLVTPGSVVRTPDGDPVEPDRLERGDSLHLSGTGHAGYVVATEITVPRKLAAGRSR
jgi:virulence-associated protein VagC